MKAISIHQPYANLIVYKTEELGLGMVQKRVENRKWNCKHRGPLLIYASKAGEGKCPSGVEYFGDDMRFGYLIGVANMVDCIQLTEEETMTGKVIRYPSINDQNRYPQLNGRSHVEGPYCFILDDIYRFESPKRHPGLQRIFNVPDSVVAEQLKPWYKSIGRLP